MIALGRAFATASLAWVAALPVATWAASASHPNAAAFGFVFTVYAIGGLICHQLPERSFWLWGMQMPVCARCTGIYLGAAACSALTLIGGRGGRLLTLGRGLDPKLILFSGALPTAVTLAVEWTAAGNPGNGVRALAGLPLGAALALVVVTVGLSGSQRVSAGLSGSQ